ncbi:MAG: hypothetical protein OEV41_06730, partial [Gammaproteobacteria bacterium]|nr:hypothetical protein [Gammaproteobacteria bacterium]
MAMHQVKTGRFPMRTLLAGGIVAIGVFLALGAVSVAGWEYTNSNNFCANACHAVHPEEPYAHQLSHHANVECVECHIGRVSTFAAMAEKSGHIAHAWSFIFGYERPTSAPSFSGSSDSCEGCHTSSPHRHNVVHNQKRFSTDRRNTESKLTLTVRLNGREFADEDRRGVNWHASGAVRFISDDPQNLSIRRVEVTLPDGSTHVYNDVRAPLSAQDIAEAEEQVMDCGDCHNRAGHPFRNPEEEVDAALADGRLSPDLPHIKTRMIELLAQDFATEEEAEQLISDAWKQYREDFPELEDRDPEAWNSAREFMEERRDFLTNLLVRTRFVGE